MQAEECKREDFNFKLFSRSLEGCRFRPSPRLKHLGTREESMSRSVLPHCSIL